MLLGHLLRQFLHITWHEYGFLHDERTGNEKHQIPPTILTTKPSVVSILIWELFGGSGSTATHFACDYRTDSTAHYTYEYERSIVVANQQVIVDLYVGLLCYPVVYLFHFLEFCLDGQNVELEPLINPVNCLTVLYTFSYTHSVNVSLPTCDLRHLPSSTILKTVAPSTIWFLTRDALKLSICAHNTTCCCTVKSSNKISRRK